MSEPIKSRQEALVCALQFEGRQKRRDELYKKLKEDDMVGLECSETVMLEKLMAEDMVQGKRLAAWIIAEAEAAGERT